MAITLYIEHDAIISPCDKYRYLLRRVWDARLPRVLVVMLNPSTADADIDDATIRALVRQCKALGFGGFEVVNLFAWRSTDPNELQRAADPIGSANDHHIEAAILRCDLAICAWGAYPGAIDRGRSVISSLRQRRPALFCFDKTKYGAPKHPLYIKTGTPLQLFCS